MKTFLADFGFAAFMFMFPVYLNSLLFVSIVTWDFEISPGNWPVVARFFLAFFLMMAVGAASAYALDQYRGGPSKQP